MTQKMMRPVGLVLMVIVALAAAMRWFYIDNVPAGGHGDVSWLGMNALDWVDKGIWQFYIREMHSPEFFPVYLIGLLVPFTGISHLPQRLITTVSGIVWVLVLFGTVRELLAHETERRRNLAGLVAAAAGALSVHFTYLQRLGMESPPYILTLTGLVWATARAYRLGGWWRWAMAGALLGLNQYIYLAARFLPILMVAWVLFGWLAHRDKPIRQTLGGWVVMAVVSALVTLPAILLFLDAPKSFSARADYGGADTGGWIWQYDTSEHGGVFGLVAQKAVQTAIGVGITWNGDYTLFGQPMLTPMFFLGFLVAIALTVRRWRELAWGWSLLGVGILLLPDFISGALPKVHALHQMGIIPFVAILAGVGGGLALDALWERVGAPRTRAWVLAGVGVLAVVPSLLGMYYYFAVYTPAQLAHPEYYWRGEQGDLDLARYIVARRDEAFLLPMAEYTRPDVAWFLAEGFRYRESAIDAQGMLQIPQLPDELVVVVPSDPLRPRHDAFVPHYSPRQMVLLWQNTVYLLPLLTSIESQALSDALPEGEADALIDRAGVELATFVTVTRPHGVLEARQVVTHPIDALFAGGVRLLGYDISETDLPLGERVDITLYWHAEQPQTQDYEVFAQLWDASQNAYALHHEFPYGGMYRSRAWATDEVVPIHAWWAVPDSLEAARYDLVAGLYRYLHDETVAVAGEDGFSERGVARVADLRYPLPSSENVDLIGARRVNFGDMLAMYALGMVDAETLEVSAGETVTLEVAWRALARPEHDYSAFLHVATAPDQPPLAQGDALIRADYPTLAWRTGDLHRDSLMVQLPTDLPSGEYDLMMGVYFWKTGERLTVLDDPQTLPESRVRLIRLVVR